MHSTYILLLCYAISVFPHYFTFKVYAEKHYFVTPIKTNVLDSYHIHNALLLSLEL